VGLDVLLPQGRWGKTLLLSGLGLSLFQTLGTLGARAGPVLFRPLDWRWFLLPVALAFLSPALTSPRSTVVARQLAAGLVLVTLAGFLGLGLARLGRASSPLSASLGRVSRLEDGGSVPLASLRLPGRKYLSRIAGRRRDVALSTEGALRAPEGGQYRFELDCDDRCTLVLDGRERIEASGRTQRTVRLAPGLHRFALDYQQEGGPARLELAWDRPALFEPLGLEHYLASESGALAPRALRLRVVAATAVAAIALLGWTLGLGLVLRAVELRREWLHASSRNPWGRRAPLLAAGLVIVYGSVLRLRALEAWAGLAPPARWERLGVLLPDYGVFEPPEDPAVVYRADVRSYLDRASSLSFRGFYEPHFREPFYVLLVQAFLRLSGGKEIGILVQSTVFSILTLPLLFWLARRWVGSWAALAVLLPVALHEWLVMEAPTGYRESAYSFFLLAFAGWVFSGAERRSAVAAVGAGVLGTMVSLVRLSGLSFVLPLLGLALWQRKTSDRWRYGALALFVLTLGVGPFLWSCYRVHGDPFYSVSFHTRFWLEAERPGEVAPPAVSVFRYLFELHRAETLLLRTLRGLTVLPLGTFWNGLAQFPLLDAAALGLGVAGLLLCLARGPRFLPLAYFGHLLPFAYIQNFPSGEMPRFVMPAYFFLMMAAGPLLEKISRRRAS
jgi:hypothetical protein